MLILHI